MLEDVRTVDNANVGFRALSGGTGITGSLDHVAAMRTSGDGIQAVAAAGTPAVTLMIANSDIVANTARGIAADGSSSTLMVGQTSITGNATGVQATTSAKINTYATTATTGIRRTGLSPCRSSRMSDAERASPAPSA